MNHAQLIDSMLKEMLHEDMISKVGHQLLKGRPLTDAQFDYFFNYYCDSGEMPYGVAKARTGDPYDWVDAKITEEYEQQTHPVAQYVTTNTDAATEFRQFCAVLTVSNLIN